jgi:hypothetical protein
MMSTGLGCSERGTPLYPADKDTKKLIPLTQLFAKFRVSIVGEYKTWRWWN